jgi:hypothetical protein
MNKKLLQDKAWLLEQCEQLSPNQIGLLVGVSGYTVRYWMRKHNIPTRSITEGMLLQSSELSKKSKKYFADPANRKKSSERLKTIQSSRKAELSESAKKNWAKNRQNILAGIVRANTNEKKCKIAKSVSESFTADRRIKQSQITKQLWATPEYVVKRQIALTKITETDEFRHKISESSTKLWLDRHYREKQATAKLNLPKTSILEAIVISILKNTYNIDAAQVALGPWTFDAGLEYNGRKILIECQGTYWHSRDERRIRDKQKHTYWEKHLSVEYELHYIYEHEFYGINCIRDRIAKILNIQPTQTDFDFNSVEVRLASPDESNQFLNQFHYLSKSRGGLRVGAFIENEVVACATFNSPTRKQSADRLQTPTTSILELDRFCIHPSFHKKNFASWFLSRASALIPRNIKFLISFADVGANHSGTIYKAAGWLFDGQTKPNYWYINGDGHRYHKKTVWDQAKRTGISEKEYAEMVGLTRINGMPVLRFIKKVA